MGETFHEIVTGYPNTGYFDWTLPDIDNSNVYIRVNAFGDNGLNLGSDLSNAPFVLLNSPTY